MKALQWACVGCTLVVAGVALSTVEQSIEVAQPIVTEECMCIRDVTYVTYAQLTWGEVVDYTASKNYIVIGDHSNPADRNAASLAGVKVKTDGYHFQEQALYGDTMRVVVDLSSMNAAAVDFEAEDIVQATIQSVLINATRSPEGWDKKTGGRMAARHLRLDVQGSPEFSALSRTYRFEDLRKNPPEKQCFCD